MKLFEPGKIGRLSVKNRIVMTAMGAVGLSETDGSGFSHRYIDYYAARAKGGVGLIKTGLTQLSREHLLLRVSDNGITDKGWLNTLADAVHDHGAKICLQLTAGTGRNGAPESAVAPSAVPCFADPSIMARELTIEEIEGMVKSFEVAAEIVSAAGIDAIELHGHAGYLIDEFMTPRWNKRTDKYGGDLEGRLRFPLELIQAIKRGAGADFPVLFSFALHHDLEGARKIHVDLEGGRVIEEGLEIVRRLEAAGVNALHIDAGCYETMYWFWPPSTLPPGCNVPWAEMVKKVVNIPIIAVGRLNYPEVAEKVLQDGKADFIALGRSLLADPEWPNKVKEGRLDDIRPCISCGECMKPVPEGRKEGTHCAVNPATGMERELTLSQADRKKSVLVIGGGPGGMEAARVAALRGHKVALYEKGYALGGNIRLSSVPDFKEGYRRLINYLSTQIKKLGVSVELGKEATLELIQQIKPDAVILATGGMLSYLEMPGEIPGKDGDNVTSSRDILNMFKGLLTWSTIKKKKGWQKILWFGGNMFARFLKPSTIAWLSRFWLPFGKRVVIIGGSYHGCEMALFLAQKGRKVMLVEGGRRILWGVIEARKQHFFSLFADNNVEILTSTNVLEVTDKGVTVADKDGNKSTLECDTVMFTVEVKPDEGLLGILKDKVPEVYAIGDCVYPHYVMDTMWKGFDTARLI